MNMKQARKRFKHDRLDITHDESRNFRTWVRLDWYKQGAKFTGKLERIYNSLYEKQRAHLDVG